MQSLPISHIGHFTSVGEKRLYDQIQRVTKSVQETADVFVRFDGKPGDSNYAARGSVLLDEVKVSPKSTFTGLCTFNGKETVGLDAECHTEPAYGAGELHEKFALRRTPDGACTWSSPHGTVRLHNGVLSFEEPTTVRE